MITYLKRRVSTLTAACVAALVVSAGGVTDSYAAGHAPTAAARLCTSASSWTTARGHVGQMVRIKGRVMSSMYARSSNGRPTFLDIGAAFPSPRRLTLVIWGVDRVNFPFAPERYLRGRMVCAQGLVTLYRGVPQIKVSIWDGSETLLSF